MAHASLRPCVMLTRLYIYIYTLGTLASRQDMYQPAANQEHLVLSTLWFAAISWSGAVKCHEVPQRY